MTHRINIGVDIDNVLSASASRIVEIVQEYIKGFSLKDWKSFYLTDCTSISKQAQEKVFEYFHSPECIENLSVIPDAVKTLIKFKQNAIGIHLLTHRPSKIELSTRRWLHKNNIPFDDIFFCDDKTVFSNHVSYLIEDNIDVAAKMAGNGTKVMLFDYPWNRLDSERLGVLRINGWKDVEEIISPEEDILDEARRLTTYDRSQSYGHPFDDFTRIGRMWGALLNIGDIEPTKIALCMMAVKMSRSVHKLTRDNIVDICGYANCIDMIENDIVKK